MQLFSSDTLQKTEEITGFIQPYQAIRPAQQVLNFVSELSKGNCTSIADLLRYVQ